MEDARWSLIAALIMAIAGCNEPAQECLTVDEFVDTWWVVADPVGLDDVCYLFSSDGHLVTKDADSNISLTEGWSTEDTNCLESVTSGDIELTITGTDDIGCITAEYEGKELTICGCQY